jgi:hypothetical protein
VGCGGETACKEALQTYTNSGTAESGGMALLSVGAAAALALAASSIWAKASLPPDAPPLPVDTDRT